MNTYDYTNFRNMERAVLQVAQAKGFDGDPFAMIPDCGSHNEEMSAIDVYLDVPKLFRDLDSEGVHQMCRAVVMSSGDRGESPSSRVVDRCDQPEHPAIRRARQKAGAA